MSILSKFFPYVLAAKGYTRSLFTRYKDDGKTTGDVDFVVTWVDGNDPAWQAEKSRYDGSVPGNSACRYRDWVTFRYWFRAVEKYAPWVRNVYLVTWGHVPAWLNLSSPKLKVVTHKEFIPKEYLPTFSSIPIELNLHRIEGLSEHFVYFNDDVFLSRPVKKTDFFVNGMPVYPAIAEPLVSPGNMVSYHVLFSVCSEANGRNDIRGSLRNHYEKWFCHEYGRAILKNISIYKSNSLNGLFFSHVGVPMRKTAFACAWEKYLTIADTCTHKFRTAMDVMHFLVTIDGILSGYFVPTSPKGLGCCINMDHFDEIRRVFANQTHQMICLNDSSSYTDHQIDEINDKLSEIFKEIFPKISSFEIW